MSNAPSQIENIQRKGDESSHENMSTSTDRDLDLDELYNDDTEETSLRGKLEKVQEELQRFEFAMLSIRSQNKLAAAASLSLHSSSGTSSQINKLSSMLTDRNGLLQSNLSKLRGVIDSDPSLNDEIREDNEKLKRIFQLRRKSRKRKRCTRDGIKYVSNDDLESNKMIGNTSKSATVMGMTNTSRSIGPSNATPTTANLVTSSLSTIAETEYLVANNKFRAPGETSSGRVLETKFRSEGLLQNVPASNSRFITSAIMVVMQFCNRLTRHDLRIRVQQEIGKMILTEFALQHKNKGYPVPTTLNAEEQDRYFKCCSHFDMACSVLRSIGWLKVTPGTLPFIASTSDASSTVSSSSRTSFTDSIAEEKETIHDSNTSDVNDKTVPGISLDETNTPLTNNPTEKYIGLASSILPIDASSINKILPTTTSTTILSSETTQQPVDSIREVDPLQSTSATIPSSFAGTTSTTVNTISKSSNLTRMISGGTLESITSSIPTTTSSSSVLPPVKTLPSFEKIENKPPEVHLTLVPGSNLLHSSLPEKQIKSNSQDSELLFNKEIKINDITPALESNCEAPSPVPSSPASLSTITTPPNNNNNINAPLSEHEYDILETESKFNSIYSNLDNLLDSYNDLRNAKRLLLSDEEMTVRNLASRLNIALPVMKYRPEPNYKKCPYLVMEGCSLRYEKELRIYTESTQRKLLPGGKHKAGSIAALTSPRYASISGKTPRDMSLIQVNSINSMLLVPHSRGETRITDNQGNVVAPEVFVKTKSVDWKTIADSMSTANNSKARGLSVDSLASIGTNDEKSVKQSKSKSGDTTSGGIRSIIPMKEVEIPGVKKLPCDWNSQWEGCVASRGDESSSGEDTDDETYNQLHIKVLKNLKDRFDQIAEAHRKKKMEESATNTSNKKKKRKTSIAGGGINP